MRIPLEQARQLMKTPAAAATTRRYSLAGVSNDWCVLLLSVVSVSPFCTLSLCSILVSLLSSFAPPSLRFLI